MQEIIKQVGSSRQLFDTVNFAFMKKTRKAPKRAVLIKEIKNFHKSKVDGLKKLSSRAHLFYDFLHFRGYPFTKSQFSQGAINAGFQTKWILTL